MSEAVRRLLVAYDIADDARRDRIAVTLQTYGERVQYSVFMVDGRPADFVRLRSALASIMDPTVDRALLCDLGDRTGAASHNVSYLGRPPRLTGDSPALIL